MEVWKLIPGYEDYEASSNGIIRRSTDSRTSPAGKVMKPKMTIHGYFCVTLRARHNGKPKCHNVHRLIAMAFHGKPESERSQACHNNGNRTDNRAENLRWDSAKNNTRDKYNHGSFDASPRGEQHWRSKLTGESVKEIRRLRAEGKKISEIAEMFSISKSTTSQIANKKLWSHID